MTTRLLRCALAAAVVLWARAATGEDWPHWRGAAHTGVIAERSGWPAGWPPKRLWSHKVGAGCTSPIIVEGRLYVMGWRGSRGRGGRGADTLHCFNAATGRELWKQSYPCPYQGRLRTGDTAAYGGPSSTPTYDKTTGLIYTLSIDGDLRCWDARRAGRLVWKINLYDLYKARRRPYVGGGTRDYGYTSSALVRGDVILVEVGAAKGLVMAFDKRTGRRRWASQYAGPAGHTGGPVPLTVDGNDCIAILTLKSIVVMRLDAGREGRTVATTKWQTEFSCNISTPGAMADRVLVTSAYNNKAACLYAVSPGRMRQVWKSRYYSTCGSPVIHRGRAYFVRGDVHCLDLAGGRLLWRGGSFGDGSCLMTADDKIIAFGKGGVALIDAGPTATTYRELARISRVVRATCYPHVTLAGGILCVKDRDGNMVCFDTGRREDSAAAPKDPDRRKPPPDKVTVKPPPMPKMSAAWPGSAEGLVFVWATAETPNRIPAAPGRPARTCTVKPRDGGKTGPGGAMALGRGAMIAQGADQALLAACKAANELTIEALITPADTRQRGPARIISFSQDGYNRNFTLCQERDALILRLRTTRTGVNGMNPQTELCKLRAAAEHHVIVTYRPGRLTCYLNGKRVLQNNKVGGDFGNWSPMHLLFGDEWKGKRYWSGRLRGIAIGARETGPAEAAARHKLALGKAGP